MENYFSNLTDEQLNQKYNEILQQKSNIDWLYYYICQEIEQRKTQQKDKIVSGFGFGGPSQHQKEVDKIVKELVKKDGK